MVNQPMGKQSFTFEKPPVITAWASVAGKKEMEGPLSNYFDHTQTDTYFGEKTWEQGEKRIQQLALETLAKKSNKEIYDFELVFSGDLLNQCIASSFGLKGFNIPYLGQYGACSTSAQSIIMSATFIESKAARAALAVTSSHFCSAERQFRFPLEYANQRPKSATWTVTGSGAFLLTSEEKMQEWKLQPFAKITGVTTGKIVDYGIKDSMNMGAAMAPAAADLIFQNLQDFKRRAEDYDKIITGDLGTVGAEILCKLLDEKGYDIANVHEDCGIKIYDGDTQGTGAGGSGCGCSAVTLSAHYLKELQMGRLKRILFVPTGALLSPVSFNEGQSVPGIAHGIVLENVG